MTDKVEASFYLVVEGKRSSYGNRPVTSLVAHRVVKTKPSKLGKNEIAVKLSVSVPTAVFRDFEPEVTIDIPGHLVSYPVSVEAHDGGEIPMAED